MNFLPPMTNKLSEVWVMKLFIWISLFVSLLSYAQSFTRDEVKAALTTHVMKNVIWPEDVTRNQYNLMVWADEHALENLRVLSGIEVREIPIQVSGATRLAQLENADVLYIPESQLGQLAALVSHLRGTQTLIITVNSPTLHNVMINVLDKVSNVSGEQMQFQINRPNIAFENLAILPELILFGGSEIDVAELYYETEQAIKRLQSQKDEAFDQLLEQQAQLQQKEQEFSRLQSQMLSLNQEMSQNQRSLEENEVKLRNLQRQVETVGEQFQQAVSEANVKQSELESAELALSNTQQDLVVFKQQVDQQKALLAEQTQQISVNQSLLREQGNELSAAQTEVRTQSELIDKQREIIYFIAMMVAIAVLAVSIITWLFLKNKKIKDTLQDTLQTLTNAQQQLVESEKMASLGQLVAGVAHEINTPIGIALTASSTLGTDAQHFKDSLEQGQLKKSEALKFSEKLIELDRLVQGNLSRCSHLVQDFKQISADQIVAEARVIYLRDYCEDIMNTLSIFLKEHNVEWDLQGENPEHNVDPGILSQILNNLTTNAVNHAFEGVQIRQINIDIATTENGTELIFKDNGIGMNEEVKSKLFDHFFTTKRGRGGTGLGMNIVQNLVMLKLNGQISVASEIGKGTTFTILLPAQ